MAVLSDTPIYDEVVELQRTWAGPFAKFALDNARDAIDARLEGPAPAVEEVPTVEQPAAQPETAPLEQQSPRRRGAPRSQQ